MEKEMLRRAKAIIELTNSNIKEEELIRLLKEHYANSLLSSASSPPS